MAHSWQFDAPSGVYKNHDMSMNLRMGAIADCVFLPFARPEGDYGAGKGESVTITRVANITEPSSPYLDELQEIPEDEITLSTHAITVREIGRSVPYTSLANQLSEFNVESPIQKALMRQLKLTLDTMVATAFQACQVKYTPTGVASSTITTNGSFSTAATSNLTVYHLEEIRDYLYDTLKCEPYEGDDWIGIFRTKAIRGIKRDPDYEEWHKYTNPSAKFNSEAGRWERVRLVETNHSQALAEVGTSSVLGEGVVFGDDCMAMAEAVSPHLLASTGDKFGRNKALAWYGVLEFGEVWPTANSGESRIIHIGST
jgi:N4-gp56 family major capsid protein